MVLVPRAQFDDPATQDRQRDELDRERQRNSDGGAAQRAAQEEQDDDKDRVDQQNGRAAEDRQRRNQRGKEEQNTDDTSDGAWLGDQWGRVTSSRSCMLALTSFAGRDLYSAVSSRWTRRWKWRRACSRRIMSLPWS